MHMACISEGSKVIYLSKKYIFNWMPFTQTSLKSTCSYDILQVLSNISKDCLDKRDLQFLARVNMNSFFKNIFVWAVVFFGLSLVTLSVAPVNAGEAFLTDIDVSNSNSHLLLHFTVADCFTEDMKKAIDSGITTTFNFYVRVYEVRDLWWDKKIADMTVNHDVQYDNLKKVYMVRLFERDDKTIFIKDFNEVKKQMSEISRLKVTELTDLQTGGRYQVCLMAELDKIRLPLYLHNVLFFLSLWDFETDWISVDFTY